MPALRGISFDISKGEVLGLIGENGAGKSTIMNIVGGIHKPSSGEMKINGAPYVPNGVTDADKAGIAFIHQELNLFTNLSIEENIFINSFPKMKNIPVIDNKLINEKSKILLKEIGLDVNPKSKIETLSTGERQLVEICKALNYDAQIIIFDEPTTSLTSNETRKLFEIIEKLKNQGRSVIYISHILEDISKLSDKIVVMRDGSVISTGKIEDYDKNRMIKEMVGKELSQIFPPLSNNVNTNIILNVKNLNKKRTVKNISFNVKEGEIVGIFGLMGAGRSELANIIFGLDDFDSGEIEFNKKIFNKKITTKKMIENGACYVTENRREDGLIMTYSIKQNFEMASLDCYSKNLLGIVENKKLNQDIETMAKKVKVKFASLEKSEIKSLSGGNQQKVVLGKWLIRTPKLLIIDEPTRGIDVGAKFEIYSIIQALTENGSGILIISSEIEELIGTCHRILVMSKGSLVGEFQNNEFKKDSILANAFNSNISANKEAAK